MPGPAPHLPLRFQLYQFSVSSLDWLFPPSCVGCGETGAHWCNLCHSRIQHVRVPVCEQCGLPQKAVTQICSECRVNEPAYNEARSWAFYGGNLRLALLRMKYQRDLGLGLVFAQILLGLFHSLEWQIDLVLPIPLAPLRQSQRGYNQVDMFAKPLSLALQAPYLPAALRRNRETLSQVGLGVEERWQNLRSAFLADSRAVAGKKILLLDDVITTGATMSSAAQAIRGAGAVSVWALSIARAHPQHHDKVNNDPVGG